MLPATRESRDWMCEGCGETFGSATDRYTCAECGYRLCDGCMEYEEEPKTGETCDECGIKDPE